MKSFLEKPYRRSAYLKFLEEFLPDFEPEEKIVKAGGILKKITVLGYSELCRVSVLEIEISEDVAKKRIVLTQEVFKILRRHRMRNALIVFDSGGEKWRLSLLTSSIKIENGRIVNENSNPRRHSYLLGKTARVNTPKHLLLDLGPVQNLAELQERFSVEVVNSRFYIAIAECFTKLVGGERGTGRTKRKYTAMLTSPAHDKAKKQEFAVRLIGRILFCWFLKERKSANGRELIPSELLSVEGRVNYYHEILEPLFFGCLDVKMNEREKSLQKAPFNQVPYLNGGLFHPQDGDYYRRAQGVDIPNEWFEEFYEILNQYNFTVDENVDFEVELAIDPEMLGRIFENLLAEINPETGKTARNATGSFYTPREIVTYMVDNSLLEYLKTRTEVAEEKINALIHYNNAEAKLTAREREQIFEAMVELTMLDPACGSGAFPMGILQKVFYILQTVDPDGEKWYARQMQSDLPEEVKADLCEKYKNGNRDYVRKLGIIQHSIFGVDIQTIAIEITKLRCFLTLVIEEKIDDARENRGIQPLPNLDFKFVAANSLVGLPHSKFQAAAFDDDEEIQKLKTISNNYFAASAETREKLKMEFAKVQARLKDTQDAYSGVTADKYKALTAWQPFDNAETGWFDSEWMFGVKDFTIVLGNPPYMQVKKGAVPDWQYPYAAVKDKGKQNLYKVFIEHGYNVAAEGGIVCYLAQSSLMCDWSAAGTRELLLKQARLLQIVEFPKKSPSERVQLFESTMQGTCICLFQKKALSETEFGISSGNTLKSIEKLNFALVNSKDIEKIYPEQLYLPLVKTTEEIKLLKKLSKNPRLGEILTVSQQGDFNLGKNSEACCTNKTRTRMYRGSGFTKYSPVVNVNRDGETEYVKAGFKPKNLQQNIENEFILGRNISGTTDRDRLIFTLGVDRRGYLCVDSVNKFLLKDQSLNRLVLGILNSKLMDWCFRRTSTNNHVNGYEVEALPMPDATQYSSEVAKEIAELVDAILKKKKRGARLGDREGQVDRLVCEMYELSEDEMGMVMEEGEKF